jgi:DNA modification methylase
LSANNNKNPFSFENQIVEGDSLNILKQLDDESIDLICTDPPYGYSFMNKNWDKAVVSVETWKECLRVLKAGSFAFIMSSPRQDVLCKMILNLIDAGFETNFTSLYHSYASGFPKASNTVVVLRKRYAEASKSQMSKMWKRILQTSQSLEHDTNRGFMQEMLDSLEQGKQYEIYAYSGGQSKNIQIPERQRQSCLERWNMLQKKEGELWSCKICKMPIGIYFNGKTRRICYGTQIDNGTINWESIDENGSCSSYQSQPFGQSFREFDVICNECITQKIRDTNLESSYLGLQPKPAIEVILCVQKPIDSKSFIDQALKNGKGITWLSDCKIPIESADMEERKSKNPNTMRKSGNNVLGDYSMSSKEPWQCPTSRFPANLIVSDDSLNDGKISKSIAHIRRNQHNKTHTLGKFNALTNYDGGPHDEESYSRYFSLDSWWDNRAQFIITPKASPSERQGSTHPTMKPIRLMSFLITMGSRPNDIILDPFCGSGTTCIAALQLGRRYIGIEKESEYCEIARKRLQPYKTQTNLLNY